MSWIGQIIGKDEGTMGRWDIQNVYDRGLLFPQTVSLPKEATSIETADRQRHDRGQEDRKSIRFEYRAVQGIECSTLQVYVCLASRTIPQTEVWQ
jgi:hypothetical protein